MRIQKCAKKSSPETNTKPFMIWFCTTKWLAILYVYLLHVSVCNSLLNCCRKRGSLWGFCCCRHLVSFVLCTHRSSPSFSLLFFHWNWPVICRWMHKVLLSIPHSFNRIFLCIPQKSSSSKFLSQNWQIFLWSFSLIQRCWFSLQITRSWCFLVLCCLWLSAWENLCPSSIMVCHLHSSSWWHWT